MRYIGAHVSAAGGVSHAPENAHAIGATGFAFFTKNQRQWVAPPISAEEADRFKQRCQELGYSPAQILPHNSYLTNMGNPDPLKRKQSVEAFIDEMSRCQQLGLIMLNFHPGSHLSQIDEDECLHLIATGINQALETTEGVCAVLENTAGQGTNLGFRFEHLAEIISRVEDKSRIGVCIDTCHAFAAGYNLATEEGYESMWEKFDRTVGLSYLRGLHLNDAMRALASRIDRHSPLGDGKIGLAAFERIAKDPRFDGLPLILETTEPARWPQEIAMLRGWAGD